MFQKIATLEKTASQRIDSLPKENKHWCNATICGCIGCAKNANVSKAEFDEWLLTNEEYKLELPDPNSDIVNQKLKDFFSTK